MRGKVLIINQSYLPLSIHEMDRAMLLWHKDKAVILESDETRTMEVFGEIMKVPTVMKMNYFVNITKKRHLKDFYSKLNVWKRDKGMCQYTGNPQCTRHVSTNNFTVDHVLPRCKGGKSEWTNIVTACKSCNNLKDNKRPEQVGLTLIKKPVVPNLIETVEKNILYKFKAMENVYHETWKKYIPKK